MAQVTTLFRREFLRNIKDDSHDAGLSLADGLRAISRGQYSTTKTGKPIVRVQGNGALMEFAIPAEGSSFGEVAVFECISSLRDLFDDRKAVLITAGNATPNSDQIFDEMMDRLTVVRSAYADRRFALLT